GQPHESFDVKLVLRKAIDVARLEDNDFAAFGLAKIVGEAINEQMITGDDFHGENVIAFFDDARADDCSIAVAGFGSAEEAVAWKPNGVNVICKSELLLFNEWQDCLNGIGAFKFTVGIGYEVIILDAGDPVVF